MRQVVDDLILGRNQLVCGCDRLFEILLSTMGDCPEGENCQQRGEHGDCDAYCKGKISGRAAHLMTIGRNRASLTSAVTFRARWTAVEGVPAIFTARSLARLSTPALAAGLQRPRKQGNSRFASAGGCSSRRLGALGCSLRDARTQFPLLSFQSSATAATPPRTPAVSSGRKIFVACPLATPWRASR